MLGLSHATPELAALLDPDQDFVRLCGGFTFTEGPIWDRRSETLYFSDVQGDARWRWSERRGAELIARPNLIGNGMVLDADGDLLVCEHATSSVVKIRPDGGRRLVAFHYQGTYLNSPNDVVTRSDGTVYFSDPDYGRRDTASGVLRRKELDFEGLFRVGPGGDTVLCAPERTFDQPNGLCFSPDETVLYVNDRNGIQAFDVAPDGSLSGTRTLRDDISSAPGENNGDPDGMKCDAAGNVWCAARGGVWVISPGGGVIGLIETPEITANLAWGGHDLRTLFLCTSTSVHSLRTLVPSAPLPYHAVA